MRKIGKENNNFEIIGESFGMMDLKGANKVPES